MKPKIRITVLYTELAEYILVCLRSLKDAGCELQLVHYPVNKEAPFQLDTSFCSMVHDRSECSDEDLHRNIKQFGPDAIMCSGWVDRGYVKLCKDYHGRIPTVLTMDNHWTGSWRQRLAVALAPFILLRSFSHAFVPGRPQRAFALKLGFNENRLATGFYSADTRKFEQLGPKKELPKRFLYLGRYVRHKGIYELWEAFGEFKQQHPEWELWCVGTGDQFEHRIEADGIRHFGFVQPDEMGAILQSCSVYVLPSHFEPWGVSVHEMAAAGFPLLLSEAVGASELFLREGENGFSFRSESKDSLRMAMERIAMLDQLQLQRMGVMSHQLGLQLTPERWAETLIRLVSTS